MKPMIANLMASHQPSTTKLTPIFRVSEMFGMIQKVDEPILDHTWFV